VASQKSWESALAVTAMRTSFLECATEAAQEDIVATTPPSAESNTLKDTIHGAEDGELTDGTLIGTEVSASQTLTMLSAQAPITKMLLVTAFLTAAK